MTANREQQLQEFFTALARVDLDDLDALEKAIGARRDYLMQCKLLSLPIGADIRWTQGSDVFDGLIVYHYRKSVLVAPSHINGEPWSEQQDEGNVTVPYELIDWSVVEQRRGRGA